MLNTCNLQLRKLSEENRKRQLQTISFPTCICLCMSVKKVKICICINQNPAISMSKLRPHVHHSGLKYTHALVHDFFFLCRKAKVSTVERLSKDKSSRSFAVKSVCFFPILDSKSLPSENFSTMTLALVTVIL